MTEASLAAKKTEGKIVELGVAHDDFAENEAAEPAETVTASGGVDSAPSAPEGEPATTATIVEAASAEAPKPAADAAPAPQASASEPTPGAPAARPFRVTTYAQLLSTGDQKAAEALAAKLIDRGFTSSYVERGTSEKGPIFRVRVKFESEPEARAAEPKLREFSKEVWITTR